MLDIARIPVLSDNYVWLAHEPSSGETAVVDPAVAEPVLAAAQARGWKITQIWNTHWHPDHTGGNAALQAPTGCPESGPAAQAARIPTLARQRPGGGTGTPGTLQAGGLRGSPPSPAPHTFYPPAVAP